MFLLWLVLSACFVALSMFAWDWLSEISQKSEQVIGDQTNRNDYDVESVAASHRES
jgi:hypothetical protein